MLSCVYQIYIKKYIYYPVHYCSSCYMRLQAHEKLNAKNSRVA